MTASLFTSVPVSNVSMTVEQHVQYQDCETEAAKFSLCDLSLYQLNVIFLFILILYIWFYVFYLFIVIND